MQERIQSFDFIRIIAFLGVYLSHSWIEPLPIGGGCAVSIFLHLSGFLYTYKYYNSNALSCNSIKTGFAFCLGKFKRMYLIHIITIIALLPFYFTGEVKEKFASMLIKVILNLLVLNGWLCIPEFNINRVSWYMSVYCLCLILFPYFIKKIKGYTKKIAIRIMLVLIMAEILIAIVVAWLDVLHALGNVDYGWFLYSWPPFRFIDFYIGCCVGVIFRDGSKRHRVLNLHHTTSVVLTIIAVVLVNYLSSLVVSMKGSGYLFRLEYMLAQVAIFSIPVSAMIISFARNSEFGANTLLRKYIAWFASLTPYMYLIHNAVFEYLGRLLWLIYGETYYMKYRTIMNCTAGLIITTVLAWTYTWIINRFEANKLRK